MDCNNDNSNPACIPYEEFIKVDSLARAYVPFQKLCGLFDIEEALIKGTAFPELASPYSRCCEKFVKEDNPCYKNKMFEENISPYPLMK